MLNNSILDCRMNNKDMELLIFCDNLIKQLNCKSNNQKEEKSFKKKIAIIYDIDGWAFHNIAIQIQKNLSDIFEIDIIPVSVFGDNIVKLVFLASNYDLVHCLWRGLISCLDNQFSQEYIKNLGLTFEQFFERYMSKVNFTSSVYDHNFLTEDTISNTNSFIKYVKNYTVSSNCLMKIYEHKNLQKAPKMVISDGVDLEKFSPKNLQRFKNIDTRKIVIGWVGNSKFLDSENDEDLKGIRKIINPVLKELVNEGQPIEIKFADRNQKYIPHEEMPFYYDSIDLYICASKNEGTPNPVLESMAMGIPIISTDVGIVRDAFGKEQTRFILEKRTQECLKEKIIELINDRELFQKLSDENLEQIKSWSWKEKCNQFATFFKENLKDIKE